jgi:predicted signal transduction protein with EAL and GGDEF domain
VHPDDAHSADQLVQNAERALAYAKKQQLGVGQFYQAEHDKELQLRKRLIRDLRHAPRREEITCTTSRWWMRATATSPRRSRWRAGSTRSLAT